VGEHVPRFSQLHSCSWEGSLSPFARVTLYRSVSLGRIILMPQLAVAGANLRAINRAKQPRH